MLQPLSDALQLKFKGLEVESNIIPCKHYFIFEGQGQRYSKGVCKYCGKIVEQPNSDFFLEGKIRTMKLTYPLNNTMRFLPDNPVDIILDCKRTPHIWQRETINYI